MSTVNANPWVRRKGIQRHSASRASAVVNGLPWARACAEKSSSPAARSTGAHGGMLASQRLKASASGRWRGAGALNRTGRSVADGAATPGIRRAIAQPPYPGMRIARSHRVMPLTRRPTSAR